MMKKILLSFLVFIFTFVASFVASDAQIITIAKKKAGGGGTTFLEDTFTETVDTPLENHSADTGGTTWGGDASGCTVYASSDRVKSENNTQRRHSFHNEVPTDNTYYVTATGSTGTTDAYNEFGAIGRWSGTQGGANRNGYQCVVRYDGSTRFFVWNANTDTSLDNDTISGFSASTEYTVKLIMAGDTYSDMSCEVYEGANLLHTLTAASHTVITQTGSAGIVLFYTSAAVTWMKAVDQ